MSAKFEVEFVMLDCVLAKVKILYIRKTWRSTFTKSWTMHQEWRKSLGGAPMRRGRGACQLQRRGDCTHRWVRGVESHPSLAMSQCRSGSGEDSTAAHARRQASPQQRPSLRPRLRLLHWRQPHLGRRAHSRQVAVRLEQRASMAVARPATAARAVAKAAAGAPAGAPAKAATMATPTALATRVALVARAASAMAVVVVCLSERKSRRRKSLVCATIAASRR